MNRSKQFKSNWKEMRSQLDLFGYRKIRKQRVKSFAFNMVDETELLPFETHYRCHLKSNH